MVLKKPSRFRQGIRKKCLWREWGNTQGQVGWGSESPDAVENVPAHCWGVGVGDP